MSSEFHNQRRKLPHAFPQCQEVIAQGAKAESTLDASAKRRLPWLILVLAAIPLVVAFALGVLLWPRMETSEVRIASGHAPKVVEARPQAQPSAQEKTKAGEKITLMPKAQEKTNNPLTSKGQQISKAQAKVQAKEPPAKVPPAEWQRLLQRGDEHARAARWQQAAADFAAALRLHPKEHWHWFRAAGLWVWLEDHVAYRQHCEEMLRRFGETSDPMLAERTAKACLLAPDAVADMSAIFRLAERAVTNTEKQPIYRYFLLARGLAHYRAGEFDQALERLGKSVAPDPAPVGLNAPAYLVTAMAHHRLGKAAEAREALGKARKIMEQKGVPTIESGDLGTGWHDLLICHILRREAEGLIQGDEAP